MTSAEMMRKMGLKEEGAAGEKLKTRIFKYLKEGKGKLLLLERKIKGGKNYRKLLDEVGRSKKRLQAARQNFDRYEKKAEEYIEKNPKKAVAMAAAAGVLVGSVWSAFKKKKPASRKKRTSLSKSRSPRGNGSST